jgi:hypothetical protein
MAPSDAMSFDAAGSGARRLHLAEAGERGNAAPQSAFRQSW